MLNKTRKDIISALFNHGDMALSGLAEYKALAELVDDDAEDQLIEWEGAEYRVIDEVAIWDIYVESMTELVKDCYLDGARNVPDWLAIDWERTAENTMVDGYGHHFSSYDGSESELNGFYVFRTN